MPKIKKMFTQLASGAKGAQSSNRLSSLNDFTMARRIEEVNDE